MLARAISSWGRLLGWGGGDPAPSEQDRRWFGRVPCDIETTCQPASGPGCDSLAARVRNVSQGGVSLVVGRPFQPGDLLSLLLPAGAGQGACWVLACVVYCGAAEGGWRLGCTFAAPLDEDDLDRFVPAVPVEQRARARHTVRARAAFLVVGEPEGEPLTADVLNLSSGGAALRTAAALPIGALLSLELRRCDGRPAATTLASVVRTSVGPDGDRIAGCNFIHELDEEQVQALL
jgi:hypothetical protein